MHISRSSRPNIVVTLGDPAGIGPEVALKALASPKISRLANFLLIGDGSVIGRARRDMGLLLSVPLLDLKNVAPGSFAYGRSHRAFGKAAIEYIDKALELIGKGEASGLVTAPLNKLSVRASGLPGFEGHTEYLARKTGAKDYAMMFVGSALKVTLVTRHVALRRVPGLLTADSVYKAIILTHRYLENFFKIRRPRIGVAGLNPHAGEGASFGNEEIEIIIPAIEKASREFKGIVGPVPADVIFYEALNKKFDAVIAMYHDQALAPFKMLYFENGVNLTLGLPFIRTSPDHGTAFNIAGKGLADPRSMIEAIRLACRLARESA